MSSPTEENSLSPNPNKSLDGDIIFVGDYINLNKTSDAVVDLTKDPLEKGKLITQSPSGDDDEQNLVDGERKAADTLLPYKLPFSATRLPRSLNTFKSEMKLTTAVTKREKWLRDGNKWDDIMPSRDLPTNIKYIVVDVETHDWKDGGPCNGRIVEQIALMVFDRDMKCLESKQYLLKPHGYDKIAQKATAVHGITTELAVEYGVDSHLVFDEFIAIVKQLPKMALSLRII